jgi:hypothetical protein
MIFEDDDMFHIEHNGITCDVINIDAAVEICPATKEDEVVVEVLQHIKQTPPPIFPYVFSTDTDKNYLFFGIRIISKAIVRGGFDYGTLLDGIIYCPHNFGADIAQMTVSSMTDCAAIYVDFINDDFRCNGHDPSQLISELTAVWKTAFDQAIIDNKLISAGKMTEHDLLRIGERFQTRRKH